MTTYTLILIESNDQDDFIEVEVYADVEMVDNGIGPYECHGYRGRHRQLEPEVIGEIKYDRSLYSAEEQRVIDEYIEDREEHIIDELCEKYEDDWCFRA